MNFQSLAQSCLPIIRKAGELLINYSKNPEMRKPQKKGDGSPVTPADEKLSAFLVEELGKTGFPVISEEALPERPPEPGESYFLVDPLDGTKYFSRGESEFAICVGFMAQGRPQFGAIFDPNDQRIYWAVRGHGAYCDQEKLKHPGISGALTVYSSGFHKRPEKDLFVEKLNIGQILEKGSALKFCDIAAGRVDLYIRFGPTSEWDTAAAQVLLEEAGCDLYEVETLQPLSYGKPNYLNRGVIACEKSLTLGVADFIRKNKPKKRG